MFLLECYCPHFLQQKIDPQFGSYPKKNAGNSAGKKNDPVSLKINDMEKGGEARTVTGEETSWTYEIVQNEILT